MAAPAPWEMDWSGQKGEEKLAPWERSYGAPKAPAKEPETGFFPALKSGYVGLGGDVAALGIPLGIEGSAEKAKELKEKAAQMYRQPELTEAPWEYVKGLAGQSLAYMTAPIVAGGIAAVAGPEAAIAGLGAAAVARFGTSVAQFVGANINRQIEAGVKPENVDTVAAVGAAIPQGALDAFALGQITGLQRVFKEAGRTLSREEAAAIVRNGVVGTTAQAVKAYGPAVIKSMGTEGLTEAAQAVLERAQAGLNITDEEARKEYFDNFVGGAILGGAISVPGQAIERGRARAQYAAEDREAARRAAEEARKEGAPLLALEGPPPFTPVGLPDGSVATTQADLDAYFKDKREKEAGEVKKPELLTLIEKINARMGEPSEPMPTDSGLTYETATQEIELLKKQPRTSETEKRIKDLQQYKMEYLMDRMTTEGVPISKELLNLRKKIEFDALPYEQRRAVIDDLLADFYSSPKGFKGIEKQKLPELKEPDVISLAEQEAEKERKQALDQLNKEAKDLAKQYKSATSQASKNALKKDLAGKIFPEEVISEIGVEKQFRYLAAPKGTKGKSIANLVGDGVLDQYLPPKMRHGADTFDAQASEEYIKEKIRNADFARFDSELNARTLGEQLAQVDAQIKELSQPRKITPESIQEETEVLSREAGYTGAPSIDEITPEAMAEEEYFPDMGQADLSEEASFAQTQSNKPQVERTTQPDGGIRSVVTRPERGVTQDTTRYKYDLVVAGEPQQIVVERNNLTGETEAYLAVDGRPIGNGLQIKEFVAEGMDPIEAVKRILPDVTDIRPSVSGKLEERQPFVINKDPENERIEKELTGKTMKQVAQWAVDNAPNEFAKVIAQKVANRINGMLARGIKMDFEITGGQSRPLKMQNSRGLVEYDFGRPGENKQPTFKMTLNGAAVIDNQAGYPPGTRYITVLHELLHVATVGQINVLKSSDPIVKDLRDLFNQVVTHFNTEVRAGRMTPFMEKMYNREINALSSPDELLAWGIADQEMQEFLSDIKVGEKSIMDKLVELIRKILNVTKDYMTALDQLVKTTESILDEDVDLVGDKIAAKQYSFGVKPGMGEAVQGSLFEKAGVSKKAKVAVEKVAKRAVSKRPEMERDAFDGVDEKLVNRLNDIFFPENKTIFDRIDGMRDNFWKKLAQGVADQYRSIKDYTEEGYMLARMSKTIDGALEGLLFNGHVTLTDGALDIKQGTKGLMQVMEPVGKEVDRFQIWMALNRDAQLVRQGKAPSVDPEIVKRVDELSRGKIGDKSRLEVYEQVRKDLNALNKSVLDIAYKQGLIDKAAYDVFANDINYIPFYKVMEDGDLQGAATASGLSRQKFSEQLKGGEKQFGDLMENTLRNWSHILSASMKNRAANATIDAAMDMGAAYPNLKVQYDWKDGKVYNANTGKLVGDGSLKAEYTTQKTGMVKTMMDGKPAYFKVVDPLLLDSISSIGYMGPKSKFLDVAKDFKNLLQFGVTISPAFKVRNLFRDSIAAMAVSDLKLSPFSNVVNGWKASSNDNPAHISALAGGAIFNFGSYYEGDQSRLIKRLLKQGVSADSILDTDEKIKKGLSQAWRKYQEWGNKSEAANRMALYQQLRDRGMSHLQASFYARDLLDFSMQGSWPAFRIVAQVVPFLNARVQGLYKLGRDGVIPTSRVIYNTVTGKPIELTDKQKAQQFGTVTGAVVLASMALYLMYKDDDEYKKREAWDRDNFWWFKLPGMEYAMRVPKPFEIGAFGTMAERVLEQIVDKGAEGKQFEESLRRMLGDTFALNPTPQMLKPLLDLYANKDSFTGAPIETAGMERLSKQERASDTTSPLAKTLGGISSIIASVAGEKTELSPVQIDYAIKAYFGWLGGTISSASHYAVMPFSKSAYPDHDWGETMSMGFVKSLPATQSRYVTEFYQNSKQISQAYADMRHYAELGQSDKVNEILQEEGDKIALAKAYDKAAKDMAKMRQVISQIRADEKMSGAEKKEQIDRIKVLIGKIAEQMETVRKSLRK